MHYYAIAPTLAYIENSVELLVTFFSNFYSLLNRTISFLYYLALPIQSSYNGKYLNSSYSINLYYMDLNI